MYLRRQSRSKLPGDVAWFCYHYLAAAFATIAAFIDLVDIRPSSSCSVKVDQKEGNSVGLL